MLKMLEHVQRPDMDKTNADYASVANQFVDSLDTEMFNYVCPKDNINSTKKEYLWHLSEHATGIKWNIFISDYIDYALHERILMLAPSERPSTDNIVKILTLLHSGYFKECYDFINADKGNIADSIKNWLKTILTNSNDIDE